MQSRNNPDVDRFDRWAATYDRSAMQRLFFGPVHSKMLALLAQELKEPPRYIVDVGCGTGRLLRTISTHWPDAQLFGIDPSEKMISEAGKLNPKATFKIGSAESIPLPGRSADIVLTSLSFHHWADHEKGVQEIARVLRPGGLFCLADLSLPLSEVFGGKIKNLKKIREYMVGAGLSIRRHQGMGMRFVHITLAQR